MKHLLSASDIDLASGVKLLDIAADMSNVNSRDIKKLPTLRGKSVVNLFYEDSTRTRISFELAEKRLSADVVNFSAKGSSVSKGESLKDTALTLSAMGADAIVVRHHASGAAHNLANSGWIDVPIINAGDGTHQHPTQALLDAFTIRRELLGDSELGADLKNVKVLIVGDLLHSRVARSNRELLQTLGAEVAFVSPATLLSPGFDINTHFFDLDQAIADFRPDVIMMLRIQNERMTNAFFPSEREYSRLYGLNQARLRSLGSTCLVMHPGPMNRGLEIAAEVADGAQSLILKQVANGISVRMAVLFHIMNSGEEQVND